MRTLAAILVTLSLLDINVQAQAAQSDLKSLYESHHWFALRKAVAHDPTSPFYKAAVETAFHQDHAAEVDLSNYIASHPTSDMLLDARELLLGIDFRNARYQDALVQAQQILSLKPDARDIANFLPTLKVLAPFVRQTVNFSHVSTVRCKLLDQNLVLPVKIGGSTANYILDNGFSLSGMSESEAKRLNLSVHTVTTQIDTMNGTHVSIRIAVVPDLLLGAVHLKNVAFYIVPDSQPPFNQLASGHRGILGIQVVLALGHFAWQPASGLFNIFPSLAAQPAADANLAFDGTSIFTQLMFRGQTVNVNLDSGAQNTVLYPSFAKRFPEIRNQSTIEEHRVTGVGGSSSIRSLVLSSLEFRLGGHDVSLKPATVLLENNNSTSDWFEGNLGMNLLNQGNIVDVDFGSMTLVLK